MASGKKQGYLEADGILLTLVLILAVFGLTMLFSTSEYNGEYVSATLPIILRNSYLLCSWGF